jgi:hypothetical protein
MRVFPLYTDRNIPLAGPPGWRISEDGAARAGQQGRGSKDGAARTGQQGRGSKDGAVKQTASTGHQGQGSKDGAAGTGQQGQGIENMASRTGPLGRRSIEGGVIGHRGRGSEETARQRERDSEDEVTETRY